MDKPTYKRPTKAKALQALRLAFSEPGVYQYRVIAIQPDEVESQEVEPREDLISTMELEPESVPPIVVEALPPDQYIQAYRVIDGHHRFDSLKRAGHEMVWAVEVAR
jgi:ParB-like chromosome segregation protein Spo0J